MSATALEWSFSGARAMGVLGAFASRRGLGPAVFEMFRY